MESLNFDRSGAVGLLMLTASFFWSCSSDESPPDDVAPPVFEAMYSRFDPAPSSRFSLDGAALIDQPLQEISGLATGRKNPEAVYAIEDSGNRNVVFVFDSSGVLLGEIVLAGATNRDWEDLAIGPGPDPDEVYIYVPDFGDNSARRTFVRIFRFPEPALRLDTVTSVFQLVISDFETITYRYPDGPRDAETLMIDPDTKDLIVVTKREPRVRVYHLPFPQSTEADALCYFRGELPFRTIVAGDISPDGSQIFIKDYGAVYWWDTVNDGDPIRTMFEMIPSTVAYVPEVQGESIAVMRDGKGYFTITEIETTDADPLLYRYRKD